MADNLRDEGAENQVKGAAKQVEGKVRNAVGGLTGDSPRRITYGASTGDDPAWRDGVVGKSSF